MNRMTCTCARAHVHTHFLYLRNGWADTVLIRYVVGERSTNRFPQVIRGTVGYRMKFPYSLSAGRDGLSISSSRLVLLDCAA